MSEIKVFYTPGKAVENRPANAGIEAHPEAVISMIAEAGVAYEAVDVSRLSRDEVEHLYTSLAVQPSVRRRYRVKRIFGTHKYPGMHFGGATPALVVFENGRPLDVYPHEEEGRIVTIADHVKRISGRRGKRELAARMDALRKRIGAVSVNVRDLIEDGRRR